VYDGGGSERAAKEALVDRYPREAFTAFLDGLTDECIAAAEPSGARTLQTRVGSYVMFQGGSRTSQDIPPFIIAGKEPIRFAGVNLIGLRRRGFSNETIEMIHDTYRTIYAQGIIKDGIAEARLKYPDSKEVEYICSFIENSKRGIIR